MIRALATLLLALSPPSPVGHWRAVLDLAGGPLPFQVELEEAAGQWRGQLCNGAACQPFTGMQWRGDSLVLELGDYAASIIVAARGDSLSGYYRNIGRRGPRTIPFRAARGRWDTGPGTPALLGSWDAWFRSGFDESPRVLEFRNGPQGLEGTVISNSGDAGLFWGQMTADSFAIGHFDGSFVYLLTGRIDGDTLRGTFHAGLRSQSSFIAVRTTGLPHLTPPSAVTRADTSVPFTFGLPDLDGRLVRSSDERFRGKVVLVDIFGTWCPTCHDAVPSLVQFYGDYHARGLEIVGLAFEATGDTAQDASLVRRYRDKYRIPFPVLLGGISEQETVSAALPQLIGFTAFPTTIFLGRDGRVRRIHAGFYGPATGAQYDALLEEMRQQVEALLAER